MLPNTKHVAYLIVTVWLELIKVHIGLLPLLPYILLILYISVYV